MKQDNNIASYIRGSGHPMLNIVTISFKIAALLSFILLDLFVSSEAVAYLVVILLGAMDFWVTKNISGRILVGLRWWNEVKDDGSEVWIYESKNESIYNLTVEKNNGADNTIFWGSLYIFFAAWLALFIWELIRLRFVWVWFYFNLRLLLLLLCLCFRGRIYMDILDARRNSKMRFLNMVQRQCLKLLIKAQK
jgi:hypothetical protein